MNSDTVASQARVIGNSNSMRIALMATICAIAALFVFASSANAAYNVNSVSVSPSTLQAGGHPTVTYEMNADAAGADSSGDDLKSLKVDLPPGFLGNPEAPGSKCTDAQFNAQGCPAASYLGTFDVTYRYRFLWYSTTTAPGKAYIMQPATVDDPI